MNYYFTILFQLGVFLILALSLNVSIGFCGLISLAHAGYFVLGCYVYALTTLYGGDFVLAIALAAAVGAVLSLALSIPSWRLKGDFFVMVSLAVQALISGLLYNWYTAGETPYGTLRNLTNGPRGITGIPKPNIFSMLIDNLPALCGLSLCLAAVMILLVAKLLASPWGRLLKSIRDDELAARSLGKSARLAKVQAFALSCALASVAGVLFVSYLGFLDPLQGRVDLSIDLLCMVLIGGAGSIRGSILGALVLVLLPEALRFTPIPDAVASDVRRMLYGLALVGMMHFRPQGLLGDYSLE